MVIAIVIVLVGMLFAAIGLIRTKARELDTANRMQAILTGLASYQESLGSRCLALQQACDLGGATTFARLPQVEAIVTNPATGGGGTDRALPKGYTKHWHPILDSGAFRMDRGTSEQTETEVVPPASGPIPDGWYVQEWPFLWPETDWYADPPGTTPPVLRFPWGAQPMVLNGGLADPELAPDAVLAELPTALVAANSANVAGRTDPALAPRKVYNSWVAMSGHNGAIWSWTCRDNDGRPAVSYCEDASYSKPRVYGYKLPAATASPITYTRSDDPGVAQQMPANRPLPFDLGWCSPLRTIALLQAAEILPRGQAGLDAYRGDRSPGQPWNDAWGSPLVVAYALYQPERCGSMDWPENAMPLRAYYLNAAKERYGYNRSLYLTVGAPGPKLRRGLPATWADEATDRTVLRDLWLQIGDTAGAARWTEASWTEPAWNGAIEKGKRGDERCYLSTPVEIR